MMDYRCYEAHELYNVLENIREAGSNPYHLFVAYVLNALYDEASEDQDDWGENEKKDVKKIIGMKIDVEICRSMLNECILDFMAAVNEKLMIEISGTSYSIRNAKKVDEQKLREIFSFVPHQGLCTIRPSIIANLSVPPSRNFNERLDEGKQNRLYFMKIVWLAAHGRYDELTDIEAAAYCFGLHYAANPMLNVDKKYFLKWHEKWYDYFLLSQKDVLKCLVDEVIYPQFFFSFSAKKMMDFNNSQGYLSSVNLVNECEAEDYWYEKAVKGKFREKTQ